MSSDSSSESEKEDKKVKEQESEQSDSSSEEEKPKKSTKKESSISESEGEDEKPKRQKYTKKKGTTKKSKTKRPPGRPKRVPDAPPVQIKGIVLDPENPKNITELLYYKTGHLKKIAQLIKNLKASSVQFITNPKELILFAQSPYKNNSVMVVFHGEKMHHFYNKMNLDLGVAAGNLITVLKKINKRHSCVGIMQEADEIGRWIDIALINGFVGIRTEQSISTIEKYSKLTDQMREQFLDTTKYAVSFNLSQYDFKRLISDSKSFHERLIFRKTGDGPLAIEYNNSDGQIKAKDILDSRNEKLSLKSVVKEGELFVVSVQVESMRAISAAALGDSVDIYLQEKMPLKTIIRVDDGITVYTQTKLSEKKIKPKKSDTESDSEEEKPKRKPTKRGKKKKKEESEEEDSDVATLALKKPPKSEEESEDESSDS